MQLHTHISELEPIEREIMAGNIQSRRLPGTASSPDVVLSSVEVDATPQTFNRASLRAIIAGAIIALMVMVALYILGLSLGALTLNAMIDVNEDPAFDLGTGAVIWIAATNLIALFLGGWTAGRLAGIPNETDGTLHGLITWGLVTLISLWMFSTTTGRIISGAAGAINEGLVMLSDGIEAVSPQAADALENEDISRASILEEGRALLQQTGDPALQPDAVEEQAGEAGGIVQDAAGNIARNPLAAEREFESAVNRLLRLDAVEDADRTDLVNILVARGNMTEEEARQTVQRWETTYRDVAEDTEETVREAGDSLTEAIALAAGVTFMGLVVGAFAAGVGGYLGAPTTVSEMPAVKREDED